jgi:hypothetical protein
MDLYDFSNIKIPGSAKTAFTCLRCNAVVVRYCDEQPYVHNFGEYGILLDVWSMLRRFFCSHMTPEGAMAANSDSWVEVNGHAVSICYRCGGTIIR